MELELKEYFGIIKKRIWMITAIVLVASITTGIISFLLYEAGVLRQYEADRQQIKRQADRKFKFRLRKVQYHAGQYVQGDHQDSGHHG